MLSIHPNTLRRWEKEGRIEAKRTPGGYRRFKLIDVRAVLEKSR